MPFASGASSFAFRSPLLFQLAREALARTAGAPSDRSPEQRDALVTVVFSVCALEGFIGETTDFIVKSAHHSPSRHPSVVALGQVMSDPTTRRLSLQAKFNLARLILTGRPYDAGSLPYQDLDLLVRLRNKIVHTEEVAAFVLRPDSTWDADIPKLVDSLRSKLILAELDPRQVAVLKVKKR